MATHESSDSNAKGEVRPTLKKALPEKIVSFDNSNFGYFLRVYFNNIYIYIYIYIIKLFS